MFFDSCLKLRWALCWGQCKQHLGCIVGHLGRSWDHAESSGILLRRSWHHLGLISGHLGCIFGLLSIILAPSRAILENLGQSWDQLRVSCFILRLSWASKKYAPSHVGQKFGSRKPTCVGHHQPTKHSPPGSHHFSAVHLR